MKFRAKKENWVGRDTISGRPATNNEGKIIEFPISKFTWDENAGPAFKAAKAVYLTALNAVDSVREAEQKITESGKYSPKGVKIKLGHHVLDNEIGTLRKAAISAEKARN